MSLFVGYNPKHASNCLWMNNQERGSIVTAQDIIWLGFIFYTSKTADLTKEMIILVPININSLTPMDVYIRPFFLKA